VIPERDRLLVQTAESMKKRFRIDVRTGTEVIEIRRDRMEVVARNLHTGEEQIVHYDDLILSPGAAPIRPPVSGFADPRVFTLRNLADMDAIKRMVEAKRPSKALVIGGGYIGLEMAEALRSQKIDVVLVELADQVLGPIDREMATPLHQQLILHGVDLRLETSVTQISAENDRLNVRLSNKAMIRCDFVVLAIGVKPEVALARQAGLEIGSLGGIVVDEHMQTSDPHIYAVGDAVEVSNYVGGFSSLIPLAGPANRQGRIAADRIFGRDSVYRKTQGTVICKVFDLSVAMTGLGEKAMKKAGLKYETIYVHPTSHAGYYPGAAPMTLKLLFDPQNGKILGAQAVGGEGVDKRIDVLATAMRAGMTVYDLKDLELCYSPPYGSAKDPVNYAGFVASNLDGDVLLCHVQDVDHPRDDQIILDVRTPGEFVAGTIPGAINIPIDDLRERLAELPKDKELLIFCQVGLRGYVACRILLQNGYRCRNLNGGYKTYQMFKGVSVLDHKTSGEFGNGGKRCSVDAVAEASVGTGRFENPAKIVKDIDVCGLQCPGPIMRLKQELESVAEGEAVSITTRDPAFAGDVVAWCRSTCNRLAELVPIGGAYRATVVRQSEEKIACPVNETKPHKQKTIVVFSSDLDRALAAFVIANGAAAMGSKVTLFFTFWGLNILRRREASMVRKNLVERMFGWFMPRGAEKLSLSKMNICGMGTWMMKKIMRKKSVLSLGEMIKTAKANGVKLVACSMSMDLMGIKPEELIDGVEAGGVASYLDCAERGNVNLFI